MDGIKQAVIMVGGMGTRLRPLTNNHPKPVLPVLDRPVLKYMIEALVGVGVREIILACGYRSEEVVSTIGDGSEYGISIRYSYEDEPMGTGGAIKLLEDTLDNTFFAINGDIFADIDLEAEMKEHFRTGAVATLALVHVDNPCEFGITRLDDDGRILEFKEKPKPEEVFSDLVNAGIYILDRSILPLMPEGRPCDISKETFIEVLERGMRMQGYVTDGYWKDVGRPRDVYLTSMYMAEKIPSKGVAEGCEISGVVNLGEGASAKGSKLGSAVLSRNCAVTGSSICSSVLMEGCVVEDSEISHCILGRNCRVGPGCKMDGMILGDDTVVPAGESLKGDRTF